VVLNPPSQYADDRNLRARQRLWEHQDPYFDLVAWVLDLAQVAHASHVLDVGCGNGAYLRALCDRHIAAIGCDLSLGMLRSGPGDAVVVNADVVSLPIRSGAFDVVLAPHMLYHVNDRTSAVEELRRALKPGGVCVVVTNGAGHMSSLRELVESAARRGTPDWAMRNPATHAFSLENGEAQLRVGFESIRCVRPVEVAPVVVRDASIVADYVASVGDHYGEEIDRDWAEIVEDVRRDAQMLIDRDGAFAVRSDAGAFICS
jgi:SAM-dependent methyltransferase